MNRRHVDSMIGDQFNGTILPNHYCLTIQKLPMRIALIAFITIPLAEMFILIKVGEIIGALPTVGLVVLTATLGIWLLRLEGIATLRRVQEKLNQGQIPETELLEGIMLLVGGALLLTPGFVTDAIGFACLIPVLRRPIARWIIHQGVIRAMNFSLKTGQPDTHGQTIEGVFEEENARDEDNNPR